MGVGEVYGDVEQIKFKKVLSCYYVLNHCLAQKQNAGQAYIVSMQLKTELDMVTIMKPNPYICRLLYTSGSSQS